MKNIILKSFIWWLTFFFTIFLCIVWYATWMNLTEVQTTDTLTKDRWNEMVTKLNSVWSKVDNLSNIPSWFIWSFYLTSCPTWWKLADWTLWTPDLRWKFIRANVTSSTYDPNYTSRTGWLGDVNKVWSTQNDEFKSHNHGIESRVINSTPWIPATWWSYYPIDLAWSVSNNAWWTETRPKNVALLFCMKQ